MKYYTNEYLNAKKYIDITEDFSSIEDKEYTEEDIKSLYQEKLNEKIKKAEELFNTPIKMIQSRDDIENNFNPLEHPKYDFSTMRIIGYQSKEEALKAYDYQVEKQNRMFENRGEFNPKKTIDIFENDYKYNLEHQKDNLPEFLLQNVDEHLLALRLIPKTFYLELLNKRKEWLELLDIVDKYKTDLNSIEDENIKFISNRLLGNLIKIDQTDSSLKLIFKSTGLINKNQSGLKCLEFKDVSNPNSQIEINTDFKSVYKHLYTEIEIDSNSKKVSFLFEKEMDLYEISFNFKELNLDLNYSLYA